MNIKITLILKPLLYYVVLAILKTKNTPILLVKGGAGAGACDEHFIKITSSKGSLFCMGLSLSGRSGQC